MITLKGDEVFTGYLFAIGKNLCFISDLKNLNNRYDLFTFTLSDLYQWAERSDIARFYATFMDLLKTRGVIKNVENVVSSEHGSLLKGDAKDNFMMGVGGFNRYQTDEGKDVIVTGNDREIIFAGPDDDQIYLADGVYRADAGSGKDMVSYYKRTRGVTADLNNRDLYQGDILLNVETLQGSFYDDALLGDDGNNILIPLNGTNIVKTFAGNDTVILDGGASEVWLDSGFNSVVVGKGNHRVHGGSGSDSFLLRGASDSRQYFEGGGGQDILGSAQSPSLELTFRGSYDSYPRAYKASLVLGFDTVNATIAIVDSGSQHVAQHYATVSFNIDVDGKRKATSKRVLIGRGSRADWKWEDLGFKNRSMEQALPELINTTSVTLNPVSVDSGFISVLDCNNHCSLTPESLVSHLPAVTLSLDGTDRITTIIGKLGNDVLTGHPNNSVLIGGGGHDSLIDMGGDNQFLPGMGNNDITAGNGFDTLLYTDQAQVWFHEYPVRTYNRSGITVNMNDSTVEHHWLSHDGEQTRSFCGLILRYRTCFRFPYNDEYYGSNQDEYYSTAVAVTGSIWAVVPILCLFPVPGRITPVCLTEAAVITHCPLTVRT